MQEHRGDGKLRLRTPNFWCWWAIRSILAVMKEVWCRWGMTNICVKICCGGGGFIYLFFFLHLALTLSKSGTLVLSCSYNWWPSDSDNSIFQSLYQISWIPQECCCILLSTLRAKPVKLSKFIFPCCSSKDVGILWLMWETLAVFFPKLRLHPKGKGTSRYQRKLKMQVEQVGFKVFFFFAWSCDLDGWHGEKKL